MKGMLLGVAITGLMAASVTAQTNTTGSMSSNTLIRQTQAVPGAATNSATTTSPATTTTTPAAAATPPSTTSTAAAPRDAAIIVCGEDISTGTTRLVVFSSSSSTGAPSIAPASPCAQALADLLVAGFGLQDVQPLNQQLQYTLVR